MPELDCYNIWKNKNSLIELYFLLDFISYGLIFLH